MSNQSTVSGYQYNGLGDRLSQTVNGNTTNYTLDLNAGLTQVLNDGTNQYLYGPSTGSGQASRIAQVNTTTLVTDYFMTDALGSVRQLMDSQGEITLANAYEPYGVLAQAAGSAQTSYGFTGELTDPSGMVYLRARYYMPNDGRFLTRDTWDGDVNLPSTLPSSLQPPSVPPASPSVPNLPPPTQTPAPFVPNLSATPIATSILDQIFATPCPTPSWTPIPSSIDEELRSIYQVHLVDGINGTWPEAYKSYILAAVKKVNEKLPFASVFSGFKFVWGCSNCTGFAYTYPDRIEFRDFFSVSETNGKFIIHELGHAFDYKVCAVWNGRSCENDIKTASPIRNRLKVDVATMSFLNRFDYGSSEDVPPFSGFAGGENDWQFTLSSQTNFSDYPGEVWADMFLGWVYGNLAIDRMNYMNNVMPEYLSLFK